MKAKNDEQTRFWAQRQGLRQLLLYFEVGQGSCALACSYCFLAKRGQYARMTVDELHAAVDFLREYAVDSPSIHMFGMEPLRAWDLIVELRRYAPDLPLSMTTSGVLLNDERIAWLTDNDVRIYVYSIDGNAHHHRFRVDHQGRNSWPRAAENLRKLCQTRQVQWVTARASWDPGPEGDYNLVARFTALEELGVRSIQVVPVTDSDTEWDEARVEEAYLRLGEHYRWGRTPSQFVNSMLDRMLAGEEHLDTGHGAGCGTGRGYWAVFPPGNRLALCQLYMEHPEGWIGSIAEGITNPLPFMAISDRVLQWHRTEFKNTERYSCRTCPAFRHCEGVGFCAGIHMQRTGDELLPPDNYCAHLRGFVSAMRKWAEEHRKRYPQRTGILNGALQSDGPCRWQAQGAATDLLEGVTC